jgi:hypothetical protein
VPNIPLQWVKESTGDVKVFRTMAVGWQVVLATLNATVMRFNQHHFTQTEDPHHEMKLIAAKQTVIASLRELRLRLDDWHNRLKVKGALSQETIDFRKEVLHTLDRIHQFKDVRNCAFHFGDPLEAPDKLMELYEYVQEFNLDDLNKMLRALRDLGLKMRQDALLAAEQLEKQGQAGS